MTTSRRTFIQGAAALPAAAAATVVKPLDAAASPATPAVPTPYTEYPWKWFVSHDGETYHDCFDTMADAIQYATECEYTIVAECQQQDFSLGVSAYRVLDEINDNNCDLIGEGEGIEYTREQEQDLERMLTAAVEAWVVKHGISITAWTFGGVRNRREVKETAQALTSAP